LHASGVDLQDIKDMKVQMKHFLLAIDESRPAFGVEESQLKNYYRNGIISFGPEFQKLLTSCERFINQVRISDRTPLLSILLEGRSGSGITAFAAYLGMISQFPYSKIISPEELVGYSESRKCDRITEIFEDAYKSPLSLIILDNIERLLDYVRIGPRFSNAVLQTLLVLIKRNPPNAKSRIIILGTTNSGHLLDDFSLREAFQVSLQAPLVEGPEQITKVFKELNVNVSDSNLATIAHSIEFPIGIKKLLLAIEMASQSGGNEITPENFAQSLSDYGA
jgi:vesicle-fusing ATPase